jgi:hypothetical protein
MRFTREDLPEPVLPMTPIVSPGIAVKEMSVRLSPPPPG